MFGIQRFKFIILADIHQNVINECNQKEQAIYRGDPGDRGAGDLGDHYQNDQANKQHGGADFTAELSTFQDLSMVLILPLN